MHSHGIILEPGILITTSLLGESQTHSTSIHSSKKCEFSHPTLTQNSETRSNKNLNELLMTDGAADKF